MTCIGRLHCQTYYLYPFASPGFWAPLPWAGPRPVGIGQNLFGRIAPSGRLLLVHLHCPTYYLYPFASGDYSAQVGTQSLNFLKFPAL